MKTTPARYLIYGLLAVGIFFAGYMANRQKDPSSSLASAEESLKYACPMHPQYKSDRAGDCPACGMRLEPVKAGETGIVSDIPAGGHPGAVQISEAKQQLMGVRTEEVRHNPSPHILRVPGRVTVDGQRLFRIIAATDGWILDMGPNTAGRFVKKNQLLASYYTRDLLSSERLFLLSTGPSDQLQKADLGYASVRTSTSINPQFPTDTLRGLGMSDIQIEEIRTTRVSAPAVNIYSPVSGFVLARNISPKQRFEKGLEFYQIADISHVWILADIFEKDREFVMPGATAVVRYQGRDFQARLSDALPQLDPQTRTLKTRFELDNPGNILLPDAFVDLELHLETQSAVTVPAEAVIDSGRRQTVYIDRGKGLFEPRLVQTGWRLGDMVQITQGLKPGERIVVSGNFLIDSESRMKWDNPGSAALAEEKKTEKDPVCGMDVDTRSPKAIKTEHQGKTYYFCAEACKKNFESNPDKYLQKLQAAQVKSVKDPVCGMDVDPQSPGVIKTAYKGATYYFCAETCRKRFEESPAKYIQKGMAALEMHGTGMHE